MTKIAFLPSLPEVWLLSTVAQKVFEGFLIATQNGQSYSAVIITLLAITPKVFMYSPVVSPTTAIIFTVSISPRA